jgi:membrane-associated phospholipid phosphatase
MLFLAFILLFLLLWLAFFAIAPALRHGLSYAGGRLARVTVLERLARNQHLTRFRAYAPVVAIVILGGLLTAWSGDQFVDLAEAVHAKSAKLGEIDTLAHAWAATQRSVDATAFFVTMTTIGGPGGVAAVIAIAAIALAVRRRWRWLLYLAVTTGGGALLNLEMKHYFARARPNLAEALRQAHGYSFPSGHAMGSTVAYLALAYLGLRVLPRWRWKSAALALAVAIILSVALSRVYLGVHWISDVTAGVTGGTMWVAITTIAYETLRRVRALRNQERARSSDLATRGE